MRRWHAKRDAGSLDLPLGAHQTLRHGRLGDEERLRDLRGGEPPERAQREGNLCIKRQCGMATGEEQFEPFVSEECPVHCVLRGFADIEQAELVRQGVFAAQSIDGAVSRRGQQPGDGRVRHAVARPALRGDGECFLGGLFGDVDIAEEADEGPRTRPILRGRRPPESLPLVDRAYLDCAAQARSRDACCEFDGSVEVLGVVEEVAAECFLHLDERAIRHQRLAVLDADGGRHFRGLQPLTGGDARGGVDRRVAGGDRLLLLGGEFAPRPPGPAASASFRGGSTT